MGWGDTSFKKMLAMPAWRYEFYLWNPHEINLRQADHWISRGSQDSWTWASSQWGCLKRLGCTAGEWHSEMWSGLYTHTHTILPVSFLCDACVHICVCGWMWLYVIHSCHGVFRGQACCWSLLSTVFETASHCTGLQAPRDSPVSASRYATGGPGLQGHALNCWAIFQPHCVLFLSRMFLIKFLWLVVKLQYNLIGWS